VDAYRQTGFSAISDPTRLAILRSLASQPLPVSELADAFPMSRPAISQHLRILSDAGLVRARRHGTQRIYAVDPEGLKALKEHFDRFWSSVLSDFKVAAEEQSTKEEKDVKHGRKSRGVKRRI